MKPDLKTFWKQKKKWILAGSILTIAAVAGCCAWYYVGHNSSEPVYVYPFDFVGMTEYWGDSQESYGPVSSDNIQTVFLPEGQTVTEVLVELGDTVKKGDLLMTFDTTLLDISLERQRLEVEKKKLELEKARKELNRINGLKPMVIPTPSDDDEEADESLGTELKKPYKISTRKEYDGSSASKALICWVRGDTALNDEIFEAVRQKAVEYQTFNAPADPLWPEETEPQELRDKDRKPKDDMENPDAEDGLSGGTPAPEKPTVQVKSYYVVIRVTSGNMSLGSRQVWQALKITGSGSGFSFQFADTVIPDHMLTSGEAAEESEPEIDYGSGYTAAEIAEMRVQQQKRIKDLEFDVKMADAEYKIMQTEMKDGGIRSKVDGQVVSLLTAEEAEMSMQPILKVSGGGGFYIEGTVNELEKEKMQIGQEVTVNDWNTGMTYTGTVDSLGDFPSNEGGWNGMGNPTASYYPFQVFVDGSADLQTGHYVSIMYSTAEGGHGVYLQNPFLRTEAGKSYVYVMGDDGRLEQRFVVTGKALWGSYTEILSGLTAEDLVAFPYGKNVKPGAAAVEGDMSNLYG